MLKGTKSTNNVKRSSFMTSMKLNFWSNFSHNFHTISTRLLVNAVLCIAVFNLPFCLFFAVLFAGTLRRSPCSSEYLKSSSWNHSFRKNNTVLIQRTFRSQPTMMCSPMWLSSYLFIYTVHVFTVYIPHIYTQC